MRCVVICWLVFVVCFSSLTAWGEEGDPRTIIHAGAEFQAEKILKMKSFTGQSASHDTTNNYKVFSPITLHKDESGLYTLKGQHYNIFTDPWIDDEGVKNEQDYAAYVILDGYISDIYPDRFVFSGNVKRFSHLERRLIIGPCDITGDLVFEDLYYDDNKESEYGLWRAHIGTIEGKNPDFTCKIEEDGIITDETYDPITIYD